MSFKAELIVLGKTYRIRRFYLSLDRKIDVKGRPTSMPTWGLCVLIDSVDDTTLTGWMVDPHKQVDGKVVLYKIDQDSKLKEIEFKKSYCYLMRDEFRSDVSYSTTLLYIKGKDIKVNTAELNQNWPGS